MNKIFLTAIAMIAFTGTTFAANEVVEKVEVVNSENPCADQWVRDMDVLQGNTSESEMDFTFEQSKKIADELFEKCLEDTYGSSPKKTIDTSLSK